MNWEIQLIRPLRTHRCGLPDIIRTLGEAVDLIDDDLPETLGLRSVWRCVKEKLVIAAETKTGRAVEDATILLERALQEEGWLVTATDADASLSTFLSLPVPWRNLTASI